MKLPLDNNAVTVEEYSIVKKNMKIKKMPQNEASKSQYFTITDLIFL